MTKYDDCPERQWPCIPSCFTDYVTPEIAAVVIAGMSERLEQPVVLVEKKLSSSNPNVVYGVSEEQAFKRYPVICQLMQDICCSDGSKPKCKDDSEKRALDHISKFTETRVIQKCCHIGISTFTRSIMILGRPIAACSSGKFLAETDKHKVNNKLKDYFKNGLITETQYNNIENALHNEDLLPCTEDFINMFSIETDILDNLTRIYMSQERHKKEWWIREQVLEQLLTCGDGDSDPWERIQRVVDWVKEQVPVKWVAVFLSQKKGDWILPLAASSGLPIDNPDKLHFNWRKSGLDNSQNSTKNKELSFIHSDPEFLRLVQKGIKHSNGDATHDINPAYLCALGTDLKGIFLVGDWDIPNVSNETLFYEHGGKAFLGALSYLLLAHATSIWAQEEAMAASQFRTRYAATAAHTMRASVHQLWNALDLSEHFSNREGREEEQRKAMDDAKRVATRLKEIVEVTMSIRAEDEGWESTVILPFGHGDLRLRLLSLAVILEDCIDTFKSLAKSKEVSIKIEDSVYGLNQIKGDLLILQIVFQNIIDNAIKYSKTGKEVRIFATETASRVQVTVQDVGWGIPEKDFYRIFEEDYQSPDVKKFARRGHGVGLYQANQYVKAHGGCIRAQSVPMHEGARLSGHLVEVTVELPVNGPI